jgi:acyl-CoA thioesterase-2
VFIGSHASKNPMRTFGGQLMAQSFVASSRTLIRDDLPPSALSVHFINGGNTAKDIEFHVTRLRDERRFANRRVDAVQDGTLLSSAMISYMSGGRGLEHAVDPPSVAEPHTQPSISDLLRGYEETVPHFVNALQPIEWRYTNDPAWVMREKGDRLPHNRVWMKARGKMPDDPLLHTAAMVYSSDTTVLDSVITTHGLSSSRLRPTIRSGFTGRSTSATGCCIRRRRRWPRIPAGWAPGISSIERAKWSPRSSKKAC